MLSTLLKREISILVNLNLLSANAFELVGPQILLFGKELNDLDKRKHLEKLWVKEKMLETTIFSFSHNVFYPYTYRNCSLSYIENVIFTYYGFDQSKILLFSKKLSFVIDTFFNPFPHNDTFWRPWETSL